MGNERTSLIGLLDWNAEGESILNIISKISVLNHFKWIELKRMILDDNLDWDSPSQINKVPKIKAEIILKIFDQLSSIKKSDPTYFNPCNVDNLYPYVSNIRLCRKCANIGIHLSIHQSHIFDHCPIHNCLLTDKCEFCKEVFGKYHFEIKNKRTDVFNLFKCKNCGHENINYKNNKSHNLKKRFRQKFNIFLNEYENWLVEVNEMYQQRLWNHKIYGPFSYSICMQICEAPLWVRKKYENQPQLTYGELWFQDGEGIKDDFTIPIKSIHAIYKTHPGVDYVVETLYEDIKNQLRILRKIFKINKEQISIARCAKHYNNIFWGKNCSIWAQAYIEVENTLTHHSIGDLEHICGGYLSRSWLIRYWYIDFAEKLYIQFRLKRRTDVFLMLKLSKIWLKKITLQLFSMALLEAYLDLLSIVDKTRSSKSVLRTVTYDLQDSMLTSFEIGGKECRLCIWREGPSLIELIQLHRNGFNGYSPNLRMNYKNYKTIHKLYNFDGELFKLSEFKEIIARNSIVKIDY